MRKLRSLVALLAVAALASSCAMGGRKWGSCAVAGGVIGATAGGITGGALANNIPDDPSDGVRGGAIAGGIVGGGLLGALLGHVICDPMEEPVAQPAPAAEAPPPSGTHIGELKGANFAFNSAKITPEGEAKLSDTVATLQKHPDIKVTCNGYTDSVGSQQYNLKLGQRRADSVKSYLGSQGIDSSRISTGSFGKENPVASNDTAEGRAENRRVEIVVE
jgi:outer membrane protein OmpA-like peptidoglycan-associated protein